MLDTIVVSVLVHQVVLREMVFRQYEIKWMVSNDNEKWSDPFTFETKSRSKLNLVV